MALEALNYLKFIPVIQELPKRPFSLLYGAVDLIEKRGIERSQNWIRPNELLKTAVSM